MPYDSIPEKPALLPQHPNTGTLLTQYASQHAATMHPPLLQNPACPPALSARCMPQLLSRGAASTHEARPAVHHRRRLDRCPPLTVQAGGPAMYRLAFGRRSNMHGNQPYLHYDVLASLQQARCTKRQHMCRRNSTGGPTDKTPAQPRHNPAPHQARQGRGAACTAGRRPAPCAAQASPCGTSCAAARRSRAGVAPSGAF
jgi:hypothetical protein